MINCVAELIHKLLAIPISPILIFLISFFYSNLRIKIRLLTISLCLFSLCSLPIIHKLISYPLISIPKYLTNYELDDIQLGVLLTAGLYKNKKGEWLPSKESQKRFLRAKKLLSEYDFSLIISGGTTLLGAPSEATIIKQFYNLDDVILETDSLNTYQSAVNLKKYCNNLHSPLLIITDRYHALRSYLTFKSKDCQVFIHYYHKNNVTYWDFIPSLYSYSYINDLIQEYLGLVYYIITLKINFFD